MWPEVYLVIAGTVIVLCVLLFAFLLMKQHSDDFVVQSKEQSGQPHQGKQSDQSGQLKQGKQGDNSKSDINANASKSVEHNNIIADNTTDKKQTSSLVAIMNNGLAQLDFAQKDMQQFSAAIHDHIVGMQELINTLIVSLFVNGHVLVEGLPGLAKTKTIHTFASLLGLDFTRVQFTPDMLPSDLVGVEIYNAHKQAFEVKLGPIVSHVVLADEINRTTPKVQSALLEAMQEHQISLGGKTFPLPQPFLVLATQNPLDQEGTYPLPEAQVDRFLCKVLVDYPTPSQEQQILSLLEQEKKLLKKDSLLSTTKIIQKRKEIQNVTISDSLKMFITTVVGETRSSAYAHYIRYGASPRGSIALMNAAKVVAYLQGRTEVYKHDICMVILPTLRHRILLTYQAKIDNITADMLLQEIVSSL